MSANWSNPSLSSTYSAFLTQLDERLDDVVQMMRSDTVTATSVPTNAIRWNPTNKYWEIFNGTNWNTVLSTTYAINVSTANAWTTGRDLVLSGDATGTFSTVSGSGNVTATVTLASVGPNTTIGSASVVPVITANAKGLVTALTSATLGSMAAQASTSISVTGGALGGVAITLPNGTGSTSEGIIQWNNTSDLLTVGTGAAFKTFVDLDSTQTLSAKTLTSPTINGGTWTIPSGTGVNTEGVIQWSTANDLLTVGTGAAFKTMVDLNSTQTLSGKTLTSPVISSISNTGTLTLPTATDTLIGRTTTDTLTNKTLTAPVISSIVNTGTLTLPTATDTLIGRTTTDTLTNKTLTAPIITGGTATTATVSSPIFAGTATGNMVYADAQRGEVATLTYAATTAVDFSLANNFTLTLTGASLLGNPTNVVAGQSGIIEILENGTGGYALTFDTNWKFAGGTDPTNTTAANSRDMLCYYAVSSTVIYASLAKDVK